MQSKSPEQEVDRLHLTDLVRKSLNRPALQISNWKVQPIHGGLEFNSAVFRFQGEAVEGGETILWSLILKTVRPSETAMDPGGIWYWKREAMAYQSGMLHRLPGGNVTAPACYDVQERPDGSLWLWMEDVKEDISGPWSVEQYAAAARHIGQFNGAYLTGQAIPSDPWITHNWLRKYVENAALGIEFIRANPHHPIVVNMLPGNFVALILAFWDERRKILDLLESLPQVFCHQDAFKRNLFTRGGKTVAIDWGYMGNAPIGAELVALIGASIGFFEIPVERVEELDRLCFEGYVLGLKDAGWNGDPRLVRMGYVLSLLYRYPIGGTVGEMLPKFLDEASRLKIEAAFTNKSANELEKTDPALAIFYQARVQEALKLLGVRKLISLISRMGIHTLRFRAGRKK